MDGNALITKFKNIVDDESIDSDFALQLANDAKLTIEQDPGRNWDMLKKYDTSITWLTTDEYTTSHALPTKFLRVVTVYIDGRIHKWRAIPFEHRERYKDIQGYYYIDTLNNTIFFTGATGSNKTINLCYLEATSDLTLTGSPVWPISAHHGVIPYKMGEIYQGGIDTDDVASKMGAANFRQYQILFNRMKAWDNEIKMAALNDMSGRRTLDLSAIPDVVDELEHRR